MQTDTKTSPATSNVGGAFLLVVALPTIMASMVKVFWYGPQYLAKLRQHEAGNLKRACIYVANDIKKSLSTKGSPCHQHNAAREKHSAPGGVPYLNCGLLRRSIAWEVDEGRLVGRVGTNVLYGRFLERGTNKMKARPFLLPALHRNASRVASILKAPML